MAKDTPQVVCRLDNSEARLLVNNQVVAEIGFTAWFDWLQNNRAFQFEPQSSITMLLWNFSAQKERRKDGMYWIAYKRFQGTLQRIHLGLSEDLSLEKLVEVSKSFPYKFHNSSIHVPGLSEKLEAKKEEILSAKSSIIVSQPSLGIETGEDDNDCLREQIEKSQLQTCSDQSLLQEKELEKLREENSHLQSQLVDYVRLNQQVENLEIEVKRVTLTCQHQQDQIKELQSQMAKLPEAIDVLRSALPLRANAGGAIKKKIERALELIDNSQ